MRVARGAATIILVASLLALPIREAQAATLVVNSTADPGDGVCDAIECTLREAIDLADADAAQDTITFDITGVGPHTIQLQSPLPTITEPVVIDGTTEPDWAVGAPVVELDGTNAGAGANGLTIDAPTTVRGLVINRFASDGIQLNFASDGTVIEGNFIGTDVAGTSALGNGDAGLIVRGPNTTIGGDTLAERNVIGGNAGPGIVILNITVVTTFDNTITGNLIGVGADGTTDLGNNRGIHVQNAPGTDIGAPDAGNVISGNTLEGVFVNGDDVGGTSLRSNLIGTVADGSAPLPNGQEGIELASPSTLQTVTVGGTEEFDGNLISGNTNDGLLVGTDLDITIQGNKIGTNLNGQNPVPNGGDGIDIDSPARIGAPAGPAAGGNIISGNLGHGIDLSQSAAGAVVQGNMIGTDPGGFSAIGNGGDGIFHHGTTITPSTTLIGGGPGFVSNVVSGNTGAGVRVDGLIGVTIQSNRIGAPAGGALPLPNDIGVVLNTDQATLGGTGADDGNVISGNTNEGVVIEQTADANLIQGNLIGVAPNGQTPLPNGSHGVSITAADANLIGGMGPDAANVIASNGGDGVRIVDTMSVSAAENAILGNSITGNTGLGIDLGGDGVTANDLLDNDLGPNGRQNFPEIDIALSGGGTTWVAGSLHSESNTTYRIEVFADPDGEGRDLIGSTVVTTDGSHNAAFSITAPVATDPGLEVTSTATELDGGTPGSTSEFSAPFTVPPCDDTAPAGGGTVVGGPGDDILCGGDGDDVFVGGGGNDFIFGGLGVNRISHAGAAGPVTVNLAAQLVSDDGEGGTDRVFDVENVIGTPFDDVIVGNDGPNHLSGLAGDDVLVGGAGADTLLGGDGQDRLLGGAGNDVLRGQGGHDVLRGQDGRDILRGQGGGDRLVGGSGADRLLGGTGSDVLRGQGGRDVLRGQGGHDVLRGQGGRDRLLGGAGADRLFGGAGSDVLRGQGGRDVLRGQGGRDRLLGGAGADRLFGGAGNDVLRGQGGPDALNGGAGTDSCKGGPGNDTLVNCEL